MDRGHRNARRTTCALVLGAALFAAGAVGAGQMARASAAKEAKQTVAPCINSLEVSACEHWITYGRGPARSRIYSTYRVDAYDPQIKRALILVHGANLTAGYLLSARYGGRDSCGSAR